MEVNSTRLMPTLRTIPKRIGDGKQLNLKRTMKKIYFALAAVAAFFAGCSNEVEPEQPTPVIVIEKNVSLSASVGDPLTKVSSDNAGIFKWQDTDAITVATNNGNIRQFTLDEIMNDGTSAEFEGTIPDITGEAINYALYPASESHNVDGTNVYFHLDEHVVWNADASGMPMLANVDGESAKFKAVGGVLKLILFNIPADADYLKFSATNKKITGDFTLAKASIASAVLTTADKSSINNDNELVIDFSANYSASKVFYIPLPTGTIDGFTVSLYENLNDADPLFSVTSPKNIVMAANKLIIAPVMNCAKATVLWSEDFSQYSANDVPSGEEGSGYGNVTVTYSSTNGAGTSPGTTKIYNENTAGTAAPELLVGKKGSGSGAAGGTFKASGIPTNGASSLVLSFKHKKTVGLTVSSGITPSATSFTTDGSETVTLTNNGSVSSFDITFTATTTNNVRLDDISVYISGSSYTAPSIDNADVTELTIAVGSLETSTSVELKNPVDGLGVSCIITYPSNEYYKWIDSAVVENNELVVTAKGANETAAAYTATVTLKASGATAKTVTVTQESALVPNPTDITAVAGNATVDISWTPNTNATGYSAYIRKSAEGSILDEEGNLKGDGKSITVTGFTLTNGKYTKTVAELDNNNEYTLYVKVSAVSEGYVAPADYVTTTFTPAVAKGTAENPYLASELCNLVETYASGQGPEGTIYVKGFVSTAYNPSSNSQRYWISDDGTTTKQFQVYNGKGISGANITESNRVNFGDWVVVAGQAINYSGTTPEFKADSQIVTHYPKLAGPEFSPEAGTYYSAKTVTISAADGATIYYTTDGTVPDENSDEYEAPIAVSADMTIKAIAVKESFVTSAVAEAAYDIEAATKLDAPTIVVDSYTHNSITFSWAAVEYSTGYQISIDGGENWLSKQEELTYTWTGLSASTSYTIYVKAIGTDNGQYTDSDAASKSQTTNAPVTLSSIALTTNPTKTTYNVGEPFSFAGAVVTATYSDDSHANVTAYCTTDYNGKTFTANDLGEKTVTVSYTEGSTQTTTFTITVAIVDVLNNAWTGISGTNYASETKTGSGSGATYSIQAAGGNSSIQLRSSNSNSGIVTTSSVGTIKKITIKWNSNTDNARKVDIYGKNSTYSAPTDLYSTNTQGTKVKSFTKSDGDGSYTFEDDYEYIGIRSNSGALYIDEIDIQWEPAATKYDVTIDSGISNGSVSASVSKAKEGDAVNLTATPAFGYVLDAWNVYKTDESTTKVTVTSNSFTMPAYDVTVSASFVLGPTISIVKTSITGVDAAGVTNASESGVYSFHNGADDSGITVTCDGTIVTGASKNNGAITYTVAANSGVAREGWIKVAYTGEDPHTVTVSQSAATYTLTVASVDNGTISATVGESNVTEGYTLTVACGSSVSLSQEAASNYSFSAWDVYQTGTSATKVSVSANAFTMPAYAVTVNATFDEASGGDQSYTITFANNANSATAISASTQATTVIADDGSRSYVNAAPFTVNSGNIYYGDTKTCIRIGKSGAASSLSIALSNTGKVKAKSIVVNCNNTGGNKNSGAKLNVNSIGQQTTTETATDYTFTFASATDITNITLEGTASIKIYSITVNY